MDKPSKKDMELGEANGFYQGREEHPLCVEVMVRHNRTYNGPDGQHAGPGTRFWMCREQYRHNKSIVVEVGSEEFKQLQKKRQNRGRPAMSTRD